LLIAPNWGLKKTQIQTYMEKEIESRGIVQGSLYEEVKLE
jgi:radical SAM superfamily enzyme